MNQRATLLLVPLLFISLHRPIFRPCDCRNQLIFFNTTPLALSFDFESHTYVSSLTREEKSKGEGEMGVLIKLVDAVLFIFFLEITISSPTLSAQVVFPSHFFPKFLVGLYHWYATEFGDYLFLEKPAFFVGLAWLHLLVVFPVTLLNLYGIVAGKSGNSSWFNKTCLIFGASALTSRVAMLAELIISTRITSKLKFVQLLFTGVALLAIVRGLAAPTPKTTIAKATPAPGRKKRA